MQYVIASAIGVGVAAVIGVAGYYVVRASHAPRAEPAAAATTASTIPHGSSAPPLIVGAAADPSQRSGLRPTTSTAASPAELVFKVYPESAVIVVDGKEQPKDTRVVARPAQGKKIEVVVRAEGFKEQSFVLDDATASPVDVWLVDLAQAAAQASATSAPTAGGQGGATDPQSGAATGAPASTAPRRPKNDPIPANPY